MMRRIIALVYLCLGTLPVFADEIVPTLIGGREADPRDFQAVVWTRGCTATVVGPRTVWYAAHCASTGESISFNALSNRYTAKCTRNPEYSSNSTADYNLCLTDKPVTGIEFESLNIDPNRVKVGDQVLLSGYGCVRPGGGGGNDGTLRIGESKVTRVWTPGSNNMDTITKSGAALCFGDSGGPAFYYPNPQQKNRFVISTNSRGDISTTSYLSASSTEIAVRFIKNWAQSNGQNGQICGAFPDAQGCRGGGGGGGGGGGQTNFVSEGRFVRMEGLIKGGNFPEGWVKNVIDQAVSYIDFEGQ